MIAMMTSRTLRQSKDILGMFLGANTRIMSTKKFSSSSGSKEIEPIRKSVFISQSYDIFTNLALEDWIYKNYDFGNHHVLMLWLNDPCVVIGRHQNPFNETNVSQLESAGIELARRNSGGGTVFHDRNNLNCTFFTPRERYDRKYNLNLITRAIYREYGIDTEISPRDDILLHGKKISGTAAKLGHPNCYHHCTLLVNSNKNHLNESLMKNEKAEIKSKATASVRSATKNLADVNKNVNIQQLLTAIGYEFLRTPAEKLCDGGRELVMQQRGFQLINPTEKWFPGLSELKENFASWDWRYGKTPNFSVQKNIQLKSDEQSHDIKLNVDVEKGLIKNIDLMLKNSTENMPIVSSLIGQPYNENNFERITNALANVSSENVKSVLAEECKNGL
ncbi:CLUMA_CG003210, isoform A [Clunio marinus]|uniref:CLUMA_CG003210, isoform A n=1 Tax=Clunio marinus TaxID=568069 RepID=A0A1J1HN37_9DIPT|nr:CLUMA_CG003210, isoform A [Clunio marinus]